MADAPLFTTEQVKEDGRNRVGSTLGQGGIAAALVLIVESALQARHWLHGELSQPLYGAYVVAVTGAASAFKNFGKLRGKQ